MPDAAARDQRDRRSRRAPPPSCSKVGTLERAVAPDLGDDERRDARRRRSAAPVSTRSAPDPFGPAPDRDLGAARVEPDRDPTRVQHAQLLDQRRALDRRGADDDAARRRRRAARPRPRPCARRRPTARRHGTRGADRLDHRRGWWRSPVRAASRSTTWIHCAPASSNSRGDAHRVVVVDGLLRRSRPGSRRTHRPSAQVDGRVAARTPDTLRACPWSTARRCPRSSPRRAAPGPRP